MDQTVSTRPTSGASCNALAEQLHETRERTHRLTEDLSLNQLMGPMLDIVNPVLWEIGHIGWFHEYWTLRHAHGEAPSIERGDRLWDSSAVAHDTRWHLDLPDRGGTMTYLANVMARQLDHLGRDNMPDTVRYFYDLSIRHEDMHVEALAYTRQTLGCSPPRNLGGPPSRTGPWPGDASVPGGRWKLGTTSAEGFVFDNEKWAHHVDVAPFRIAKAPVTNAEFAEFVEAGGYRAREYWSDSGWNWRVRAGSERPAYWLPKSGSAWTWRRYDREEELPRDAPVVFVNWYEADAWCRWAERRLPTEAEWEAAAIGEPAVHGARLADLKRRWPWGDEDPSLNRANLDLAFDAAADVSAFANGDSAFGCRQMIGNIWEWTASDFLPFPGFSPDPYTDYSQPWFGTRKVLRGGCWATSRRIARSAYRNFFAPDRNDVFAGFRTCAP